MDLVPHLRIFLSSPGDVPKERKIALRVIEELQYEPHLRGKVSLDPVAWDDPTCGTVMTPTKSPQECIEEELTRPAECDIVIVIFWARMGTPLPHPLYHKANGQPYYSGAEWEYENAMEAAREHKRPQVVVYRRLEDPEIKLGAPDFEDRAEQYRRVREFFEKFRDRETGANLGGWNGYQKPAEFRKLFKRDLQRLVEKLLKTAVVRHTAPEAPPPKLWEGSPFPGLRAFEEKDAEIFFGRDREIDALVDRINRDRFVAVVGASGSGKSSLVWAGLIPALQGNSIRSERAASSDWLWLRMTPGGVGDNPFMALAVELKAKAGVHGIEAREIAEKLAAKPDALAAMIPQLLSGKPKWAELLLFIDQFEELVTVVAECYRAPFAQMLSQAVAAGRFRVVATLRADFYHQMIPVDPALVSLLQNGSYPLGAPDGVSLYEMIARPAERAGLQFEGDLAHRIVKDTGTEPGALALVAYLLDELYQRQERRADRRLTTGDYEELGGVAGAIGKRAEQAFGQLSPEAQEALPLVFLRLVKVDPKDGTATRRRALLEEIVPSAPQAELVRELTKARLLVTDKQEKRPTLEVAHEALLRSWERLAGWIKLTREDQLLRDQVKEAADEWNRKQRKQEYRWPDERLQPVYKMIDRLELDQGRDFNEVEREFVQRESDRLLEEIQNPDTPHIRRSWIGERLTMIGDPRPGVGVCPDGLSDIDWCLVEVPGKSSVEVEVETVGKVEVHVPFQIARYPVTYKQFQAFVEAPDGLPNNEIDWFEGLKAGSDERKMEEQRFKFANHPRETVSWHQAMAFCRWLSWRLYMASEGDPRVIPSAAKNLSSIPTNPSKSISRSRPERPRRFDPMNPFTWAVRLPTEAEWQLAGAGPSAKTYPWGNNWDPRFANTTESGLGRTTAVGMYPAGAAAWGALDMSGNVWEWTLTEYQSGKSGELAGGESRVGRGGSCSSTRTSLVPLFATTSIPTTATTSSGFGLLGSSLLLSSVLCCSELWALTTRAWRESSKIFTRWVRSGWDASGTSACASPRYPRNGHD